MIIRNGHIRVKSVSILQAENGCWYFLPFLSNLDERGICVRRTGNLCPLGGDSVSVERGICVFLTGIQYKRKNNKDI